MGNQQTTAVKATRPQQFVSQAHSDWVKQMDQLYKNRPTLTKTVILPPGVELSDPRLEQGVVVAERKYTLPVGQVPEWPEDTPFECDVDGRLLPPCWGTSQLHCHYAVYPNKFFPELNCGYCELHRTAHPETKEPIPTTTTFDPVIHTSPQFVSIGDLDEAQMLNDIRENDKRRITEETIETREPEFVSASAGSPDDSPIIEQLS